MKVAVTSLTRDRLEYTKHCFATLREFAGCDFDHYVFDNGSEDGTREWLRTQSSIAAILSPENIGIHRALNRLLDGTIKTNDYDVVVNVDNDCELTVADTLRATVELAVLHPTWTVGPHVQGLRHPPPIHHVIEADGLRVGVTSIIGGIFMPLPHGWRYPEHDGPPDGDSRVSAQAELCGYLLDYPVNHVETTDGQHERYPEYFLRRQAEGTPD